MKCSTGMMSFETRLMLFEVVTMGLGIGMILFEARTMSSEIGMIPSQTGTMSLKATTLLF